MQVKIEWMDVMKSSYDVLSGALPARWGSSFSSGSPTGRLRLRIRRLRSTSLGARSRTASISTCSTVLDAIPSRRVARTRGHGRAKRLPVHTPRSSSELTLRTADPAREHHGACGPLVWHHTRHAHPRDAEHTHPAPTPTSHPAIHRTSTASIHRPTADVGALVPTRRRPLPSHVEPLPFGTLASRSSSRSGGQRGNYDRG
ncbi:hypothetical protein EDB19DRAFT_278536 [Suillus lakei]|nr:hypothetical protein EDB19DRAFT_278536 [Suillus lakei]